MVQILDYGVDSDGTPYIAMELLRGENLAARLERTGKLTPHEAARIMGQAARAITTAHDAGIVHRDLKPDNIFLVSEGDEIIAKVLDFGIARQIGGLSQGARLKTKTGAVLGTPYYMSPEQSIGQAVEHLSDIWSFGVIAFECLTGRRAFDSESLGGLFHQICMAPMPIPSQVASVPSGFDGWFAKAASRDPSTRFQSVREAADSLRAICEQAVVRTISNPAPSECVPTVPFRGHGVEPTARALIDPKELTYGFDNTAPPALHTVPGVPRPASRLFVLSIAIGGGLLVATGAYLAWQWIDGASPEPPSITGMSAPTAPTTPVYLAPTISSSTQQVPAGSANAAASTREERW